MVLQFRFLENSQLQKTNKQYQPLFICGTGRSGTTLLSNILGRHSEIFAETSELHIFTNPKGLINLRDSLSKYWSIHSMNSILRFKEFMLSRRQSSPLKRKLIVNAHRLLPNSLTRKIVSLLGGYNIANLGNIFGLEHFDETLNSFISSLTNSYGNSRMPICFQHSEITELISCFVNNLFSKKLQQLNKKIWCDDTPQSLIFADNLLEIFPKMKLIHI